MPNGKRKRKPKTSKGIHGGGGKTALTAVQKVLMGKGLLNSKPSHNGRPRPKGEEGA